jgi:hypothetical protein
MKIVKLFAFFVVLIGLGRNSSAQPDLTAKLLGENPWRSVPLLNSIDVPNFGAYSQNNSQLFVWGGFGMIPGSLSSSSIGAVYTGSTNQWQRTTNLGAPAPRYNATCITIPSGFFVFGGQSGQLGNTDYNDGGIYDPQTDTWSTVLTPPQTIGGTLSLAAWSGEEILVWGGYYGGQSRHTGAAYNPTDRTWRQISTINAPSCVFGAFHCWTSFGWFVFAGYNQFGQPAEDGAIYDPRSNVWTTLPSCPFVARPLELVPYTPFPSSTAVWTGEDVMIFTANPVLVATSVFAYRPSTQQWRSINAAGLPKFTSAIWSGKEVYCANAKQGNLLAQIYAYNPVTDKWRAISNGPVTAQTNPLIFAWVGGRYVVYEPRRQMLSYNPLADQ